MTNELKIIIREVERFNDSIKKDMDQKRFTDTGKAKNSLRISVNENQGIVTSYGADYIQFLNRGSFKWNGDIVKNTKILGFILDITGWGKRKGVNPYAAANAIVKKGSQVAQGKRRGIELETKIENLRKTLKEKLPKMAKESLLIELNSIHKRIKDVG